METRKYLFETLWKRFLTEGIGATVVIGNLEVALSDFWTSGDTSDTLNRVNSNDPAKLTALPFMTWDVATQKLKAAGDGWRLPTREEFETILNPNQSKLKVYKPAGDFPVKQAIIQYPMEAFYWTSDKAEGADDDSTYHSAWTFKDRGYSVSRYSYDEHAVLAVRDASLATKN